MPHLEPALDALTHAAAVCRHIQVRLDDVRSMTKDDRSPVTIADFASQAVIAAMLREHLGAIVLVAEESADFLREPAHAAHLAAVVSALHDSGAWTNATPDDVLEAIDLGAGDPRGPLARADGFWTLDPVDGTKGFLRNEQYAISLAYIDAQGPALGVLRCPILRSSPEGEVPRLCEAEGAARQPSASALGCLFHATRHQGAMQQSELLETIIEIDIHHPDLAPGVLPRIAESVESAHSDQTWSARIAAALGATAPPLRIDSQAKYAVVARAEADLYLRLPTKPGYVERIWDHAAGALIAQEAGCLVSDVDGRPLDFSQGRGLANNRGIICAPPALHAQVLLATRA